MKITFSEIKFRNQGDCDVLNLGGIQSVTLDTNTKICTINCANGTYNSPYTNYSYSYEGGIHHTSFVCMKPYTKHLDEYIEIAIIDHSGRVSISYYPSKSVGELFKNKCKFFCS
jgi:hypothetical protein